MAAYDRQASRAVRCASWRLPGIALLIDHSRRDHEKVVLDLSEMDVWIARDANVKAEDDD